MINRLDTVKCSPLLSALIDRTTRGEILGAVYRLMTGQGGLTSSVPIWLWPADVNETAASRATRSATQGFEWSRRARRGRVLDVAAARRFLHLEISLDSRTSIPKDLSHPLFDQEKMK